MRKVKYAELMKLRAKFVQHGFNDGYEAIKMLSKVNDTCETAAKEARRIVSHWFNFCTGRSIAMFLGWAK